MAVDADKMKNKSPRQAIQEDLIDGLDNDISDWLKKNYPEGKRRYNLKGYLTKEIIDSLVQRFTDAGWIVRHVNDNLDGQYLEITKADEAALKKGK
jgi:hypothetical protein